MTQVDFYIVNGDGAAALKVACRVADKAVQHGQRVLIRTASQAEANELDGLLWTFTDDSFLPHRLVVEAAADRDDEADADSHSDGDIHESGNGHVTVEPVLIAAATHAASAKLYPVLINLAPDAPESAGQHTRIAEVVDSDPEHRQQGRERYRYYRAQGFKLLSHEI